MRIWKLTSGSARSGTSVSALLTLSAIKSRLGFDCMTNCEFLIKVVFIFVVSIVKRRKKRKKEVNQPFLFSPYRVQGEKKSPQCTIGDINQLRLNFSILRIFSFSSIYYSNKFRFQFSDSFYCSSFLFQPSNPNTAAVPGIFLIKESVLWYTFFFFFAGVPGKVQWKPPGNHQLPHGKPACTPPHTARLRRSSWHWHFKSSRGSNIPSRTTLRVRTELWFHVDFFSHTSLNLSVWLSVRAVITSQTTEDKKDSDAVFPTLLQTCVT